MRGQRWRRCPAIESHPCSFVLFTTSWLRTSQKKSCPFITGTTPLFSFTTTRDRAIRFENGQFVMIGLEVDGRPLTRAYSIASANYEETLEFFSIKVPNGPLTSRLQHLKPGDDLLVSRKPTGTLVLHDLLPGKNLYLFSTGTGLAPFMSVIRDLDVYDRFEKVILIHGVRTVSEVAYEHYITNELPHHEFPRRGRTR